MQIYVHTCATHTISRPVPTFFLDVKSYKWFGIHSTIRKDTHRLNESKSTIKGLKCWKCRHLK